jgi:hypothetical protein
MGQPVGGDVFLVAWEETVVTPRFPPWPSLWMGGYGWIPRANRGVVARELRAQCFVIHDGGGPHALLRVDVVGIPREVHQEIRRRVLAADAIASSDFLISCSHTHSGAQIGATHIDPYIGMDLQPADIEAVTGSTDMFIDTVVDLVHTAINAEPIPVTLGYAEGQAKLGFNRVGLHDVITDVPVLVASRVEDGSPAAVLFGYACHPVSRGNDQSFDSDFCGFAAQAITNTLAVPAMFFQGTAGDQEPDGPHNPGKVVQLGTELAQAVIDVLDGGDFTPVAGPIDTRLTEVELDFAVDLTDPVVVAELEAKYQDRLDDPRTTPYARRHAEVILGQIADHRLPTSIPMPIQRWRFDGLTIVALAHEVLAGYHVRIKGLIDTPLWIMAYANETGCYIPDDATLLSGGDLHAGYEAGWTDDPRIVGDATNMMVYGWPAPLAPTVAGARPTSTENVVMAAVRAALDEG